MKTNKLPLITQHFAKHVRVFLVHESHVYIIHEHRKRSLVIKPTRCTNFSNLFWNESLHVSDSSSVHHQEFFTVQTAMVLVMQVCEQLASWIRMSILILLASCQQTCMTYTTVVCTVKNSC